MRKITYGDLILSSELVTIAKISNYLRKGVMCIGFHTSIFGEHRYSLQFAEVENTKQFENLRGDTPMVIYQIGRSCETPMDAFNSALKWCSVEDGAWIRMARERVELAAERYLQLQVA